MRRGPTPRTEITDTPQNTQRLDGTEGRKKAERRQNVNTFSICNALLYIRGKSAAHKHRKRRVEQLVNKRQQHNLKTKYLISQNTKYLIISISPSLKMSIHQELCFWSTDKHKNCTGFLILIWCVKTAHKGELFKQQLTETF